MAPPTPARELIVLPLSALTGDETFRLREVGDVSSLAQSIAQVGQLFPIEVRQVGEGYQAVTGFRRLAALRMLLRERVFARVHPSLDDGEAALLAAADSLDSRALERDELVAMRETYRERSWSTPALEELIGRAIQKAEERLEDLEAMLLGLEPPDRSVEDEDAGEWDDEPAERVARPTLAAPLPASGLVAPDGAEVQAAANTRKSGGMRDLAGGEREPDGTQAPLEPPLPIPLGGVLPTGRGALAQDVVVRLADLTLDLGTLLENWQNVPEELRGAIRDQLDYYLAVQGWLDRAG